MRPTKTFATALLAAGALALAACGGGDDGDAAPAPTAAPAEQPTTVAPAAPSVGSVAVTIRETPLGRVLVGTDGRTLYGFTNDINAQSTCYGACAEAWPPVLVEPDWAVGPGLDSGVFSTVLREDGTEQLVAGKFPLYAYAGDGAPGEVNGQGSGDVWFVVGSDAKLVIEAGPTAAPPTTAAPAAPAPAPASLKVAESPLGNIVVDAEGNTLYGFTKDADGTSTCVDACAKAWPPAVVPGAPTVEGVDPALVSTIQRADGSTQLKVGKWPVYRFAGDAQRGDTGGQGSGGVWFVIAPDGKLIKG